MIQASQLELREIELQLKEPFRISSGSRSTRRVLLVQVTDVDGEVGWGECVAGEEPHYSSETTDTAWLAICEWLGRRLLSRSFGHPDEIFPVLDENIRGHNMAKAALEMAGWDLAARKSGVSLARLIGGERDRIEVGISIGIQNRPEDLVRKVADAVQKSYRRIKIKISPGADLEYLQAVRMEFGDRIQWMVDANNAYTLDSISLFRELDEFNLMMIEQPLAHDDLLRHSALQKEIRTPICLDESITSPERAVDMIALGAGRVINIKPGRVGGFSRALAIHDLCSENGVPVWCGGMLESGVGRGHNVALASLSNFVYPGDISPSQRYWEKDIVIPEWVMSPDGTIPVPKDLPGLGVEVDLDHIDNVTVRRFHLG